MFQIFLHSSFVDLLKDLAPLLKSTCFLRFLQKLTGFWQIQADSLGKIRTCIIQSFLLRPCDLDDTIGWRWIFPFLWAHRCTEHSKFNTKKLFPSFFLACVAPNEYLSLIGFTRQPRRSWCESPQCYLNTEMFDVAFKLRIIRLYFIWIPTVMSVFLVMQMNTGGNQQNPLPIGKEKSSSPAN